MGLIDIGAGAIDRVGILTLNGRTVIDFNNPANDTGSIDIFELWCYSDQANVKMGTFSGSGSTYDDRDYETIGSVTSGAKRIFTDLDCDVVTGDFIGHYQSTGTHELTTTGMDGIGYYTGDAFGSGSHTYSVAAYADDAISLYGTGATPETPKTSSDTGSGADAKDSASPAAVMTGNDSGQCGQILIG